MFYAYILKSIKNGIHYYGSTKNLESRLKEHNYGHVRSTKAHRPLTIHYYESFESKHEALKRELFFKSIEGYKWLRKNKKIP
jgi:putative endonuclease